MTADFRLRHKCEALAESVWRLGFPDRETGSPPAFGPSADCAEQCAVLRVKPKTLHSHTPRLGYRGREACPTEIGFGIRSVFGAKADFASGPTAA